MVRKIFTTAILLTIALVFVSASHAEGAKEPKKEVYEKNISGEVSGVSSNFIAIVYSVNETGGMEMACTVAKDAKVKGKNSLSDIKPGDTVAVSYEETIEKDEKGIVTVKSRVAKNINFIKGSSFSAEAPEEATDESGTQTESK